MFHPHFRLGAPSGGDLLAELGVRPELVREIAEDERAIRCPDRGAVYPEHGFAGPGPGPEQAPGSGSGQAPRGKRGAPRAPTSE